MSQDYRIKLNETAKGSWRWRVWPVEADPDTEDPAGGGVAPSEELASTSAEYWSQHHTEPRLTEREYVFTVS